MTDIDVRNLCKTAPKAIVWGQAIDGKSRRANVLLTLTPALLILTTATGLLLAML